MTASDHLHDARCRAVTFDPETGHYTGRMAFDPDNCGRCRTEQESTDD